MQNVNEVEVKSVFGLKCVVVGGTSEKLLLRVNSGLWLVCFGPILGLKYC